MRLLVTLSFVLSCTIATTDFFIDGEFDSTTNSPTIRLKDTGFEITGRVILANPHHACSKLKNPEEVSGNIMYVEKKKGVTTQCRIAEILKHAQDANASAVIYENDVYGGGFGFLSYYTNWELSRKDWKIHIVEIAKNSAVSKALESNSSVVTATVRDGINHVTELRDPLIVFSILFGCWAIGLVLLAAYKWRLFIKANRLQASISQMCLCLEIIASILRLLSVIDPPFSRGIYPGPVTAAWDLFIWPIVLTSTLLMTFYWEEAMRSAAIYSYPTLRKMKLPFAICVFILMLMACLTVMLRGLNVDLQKGAGINGIIILCFTIPIAIFYCVAAFQVLSRLYKTSSLSKRESSLYRMTAFLSGVGASMVGGIIFLLLLAALPITKNWYIVSRFGLGLFGYLVSTFQILAFQNPGLAGSSSKHSMESKTHQDMSRNPSTAKIPTLEELEAAASQSEETLNQDVS